MPLNNAATEDLDTRFKWLVARTRDSVQEIKKDVSKTTQPQAAGLSVNSATVLKNFIKYTKEGTSNNTEHTVSNTPAKIKTGIAGTSSKTAVFKATPFNKKIFTQITGVPFVKLQKPTIPHSPKFASSSKASTTQQKDKQEKPTEVKQTKPKLIKKSSFGASNIPFVPVKKTVTVKPFKFHSTTKEKKESKDSTQIAAASKIVAKPAAPNAKPKAAVPKAAAKQTLKTEINGRMPTTPKRITTKAIKATPMQGMKKTIKATPMQAIKNTIKATPKQVASKTTKAALPGTQRKVLPAKKEQKPNTATASKIASTKMISKETHNVRQTATKPTTNQKIAPTPMKPRLGEKVSTTTKRKFGSSTPLHQKLHLKPENKCVPSSCAKLNPRLQAHNASSSTQKNGALPLFKTPMKSHDAASKTTKPKLKRLPTKFIDFVTRMQQKEEERQEKLRHEREKQEEEIKAMCRSTCTKAKKRTCDSTVKGTTTATTKKLIKPKPLNFDK